MIIFLGFLFVVAALPLAALLDAWVLTKLWGWFLIPLGLPQITIIPAFGIALIVRFLTKDLETAREDYKGKWWLPALHQLVFPFVYLVLGWVAHLFQ